jgi:hypothetical protein
MILILLCAGALMVATWTGLGWMMVSEPFRFSDRGEAPPVRTLPPAIDFWNCVIVRWEPGTPPEVQCPAATE